MKLTPLLFGASLILNAALIAFVAFSSHGSLLHPGSSTGSASSSPAPSTSTRAGAPGSTSSVNASPEALAAAFKSNDPRALRDQLRALGLPESTVQAMIRASLWQPYFDRQRAILAAKTSDAGPYWRSPLQASNRSYSREERAELRTLASQLREQTIALLGVEGLDMRGTLSSRYSFLAPETAAKLADLDRDYGEMRQEINQESERFKVPSDADKLKFLEQERRKDLEATLSPSELEAYNLRFSPAAYTLRSRLSQIDLSEAEYRDLYDLQQAFYNGQTDSALARPLPNKKFTPEQLSQLQARAKNYETLNQEILQTLGEDRYALYQRASDNDYRQLQAATDRFNLAPATADQVYAFRDAVASASQQIAADAALTPEQKKQALVQLVTDTRAKISSALGSEIAAAYLDKNMKWLERVQSGNAVTFASTGNRVSYKPIVPPVSPVRRPPTAVPPEKR